VGDAKASLFPTSPGGSERTLFQVFVNGVGGEAEDFGGFFDGINAVHVLPKFTSFYKFFTGINNVSIEVRCCQWGDC